MKTILSKKSLITLAVLSMTLALAHTANAQATDTFTEGAITGNTDVDAQGYAVLAYDFAGTSVAVNGVDFSGNTTQNGVTFDLTVGNPQSASVFAETSPLSTAYASILNTATLDQNADGTLEFSGLTSGDTYQVQIFVYDDRDSGGSINERTATFTGSTDVASDYVTLSYSGTTAGSWAIATFVASGATQTFDLDSPNFQINAVDVRDLSSATVAVPEPSSYLMIGLGLVGLVVLRRRRGSKVA